MKLLIINPNSTQRMTELIRLTVRKTGDECATVVGPDAGPAAIETSLDEEVAVEATIDLLHREPALLREATGVLIACYGDPGMASIAALTRVPVFGIAQISMGIAASLSEAFGLIVAKPSAIPIMVSLARQYGHPLLPSSIEPSGASVLELLDDPENAYPKVLSAALRLKQRGLDAVCLGCASMGQYATRLRQDTGLIVIDAVESSVSAIRNAA